MARSYNQEFFADQVDGSEKSAAVVAALVLEFMPEIQSVVDVGCGTGAWTKAFLDRGVPRGIGVDGAYVRKDQLRIPPENFIAKDLTRPWRLDQKFDLCVSMEVAEHLPESRAESFVADLTALAPVVLFSAAVPEQGGTNHINEQWPEYWNNLFEKQGYRVIDCIRPRIWPDKRVAYWYRQNALLFADVEHYPKLAAIPTQAPLSIVHPVLALTRPVHTRKMLIKSFIEINKWSVQVRMNRLRRLLGGIFIVGRGSC